MKNIAANNNIMENKVKNLVEWYRNQPKLSYSEGYVKEQLRCIDEVFSKLNIKDMNFVNDCKCIVECIINLNEHTQNNKNLVNHIHTEYERMCKCYRICPLREYFKVLCNVDIKSACPPCELS